jgi:manganese-dependent ADP-ribose/CDP-alcohol diphosphatase
MPDFSFGIMSDCQYADADDIDVNVLGTEEYIHNRYRQSPRKLQEAIDEFNRHELQFIVHLGDFVDRNLDDVTTLQTITASSQAPIWHVLGNHDFLHSEIKHEEIIKQFGMPGKYYTKDCYGYRFTVLDTNDVGMIEYPEGSAEWEAGKSYFEAYKQTGAMNAYPWNGAIGDKQLAWLKTQMIEAKAAGQKVILFAHHPVFPPNVHDALNREEILSLIDEFDNVVAYINGHNHLGNFGKRGNVPFLTVNGMLEGDQNAFGIVHVAADKIEIEGHGRLPSMTW